MGKKSETTDFLSSLFDFINAKEHRSENQIVFYWPAKWGEGMVSLLRKKELLKDYKYFNELNDFIEWIYNHEFNRIIIDIWRPGNGEPIYDVGIIRKIRNDFPACKIMITSALPSLMVTALLLGADSFFHIPFSYDDLMAMINE